MGFAPWFMLAFVMFGSLSFVVVAHQINKILDDELEDVFGEEVDEEEDW